MNCPFCGLSLSVLGVICPSCKSDLPPQHLLPIYAKILKSKRELASLENRKLLEELAKKEFALRQDLIEIAKIRESEREQQVREQSEERKRLEQLAETERLRKFNEEAAAAAHTLQVKRKKRNKNIATFLIPFILSISIFGGVKYSFAVKAAHKVQADCQILIKVNSAGLIPITPMLDIAYFASNAVANKDAKNYDFRSAKIYLDSRLLRIEINESQLRTNKVKTFWASSLQNAKKLSDLIGIEEVGQNIAGLRDGNKTLVTLLEKQVSLFEKSACSNFFAQQKIGSKSTLPRNLFLVAKAKPTQKNTENRLQKEAKIATVKTTQKAGLAYLDLLIKDGISCKKIKGDGIGISWGDGRESLDYQTTCMQSSIDGESQFFLLINTAPSYQNYLERVGGQAALSLCYRAVIGEPGYERDYKSSSFIPGKIASFQTAVQYPNGEGDMIHLREFLSWNQVVLQAINSRFGGSDNCRS